MKRIIIANKTFTLFKEGKRTFIHVLREEIQKDELTFGDKVIIVNKDNNEELELTFWFMNDFKEIQKFVFLVFAWNCEEEFFKKIQHQAHELNRNRKGRSAEVKAPTESGIRNFLYYQMQALSGLIYIDDRVFVSEGDTIRFLEYNGDDISKMKDYTVLDVLSLASEHRVYSLFPNNLWNR